MSDGAVDEAPEGLLFLDACCVINLAATRRMDEILAASGYRCVVAGYVAREEALGLAGDEDDLSERQPIDLSPLVGSGRLAVREVASLEEQREFVRYATQIDDGEAWTCAFAKLSGGTVATDDRKTLRLLEEEHVGTVQTPALLHTWATAQRVAAEDVGKALARIERFACFRPRSRSPLFDWWRRHLPD